MKRNTIGRFLMTGLISAAATVGTFIAYADDGPRPAARNIETRSVTVSYADLDLTKEAGVKSLYQRLRTAARQVCGNKDSRYLEDVKDWQRCHDSALETAVNNVGNVRLTAVHQERTGNSGHVVVPLAGLP